MALPKFTETALQRLSGLDPFPEPPLIRLRYPVVFMHGFGLIASLQRGGHLHGEAMHLRRHGVWAYAPNVAPYHTVVTRAEMWEDRFRHVLEETGAARLNLVAHSMGGLDARFLISRAGWAEEVASLTTVATPHHGTALADLVMRQPERVRTWLGGVADWIGATALEDGTSDFLTAVAELRPAHLAEAFNPATPDAPSVRYFSYAGRAGKGTDVPISPFFRLQNRLLYEREGENDGYVSAQSARWGTFLGAFDGDHGRQVGLEPIPGTRPIAHDFYRAVARMLAEEGL